jgi:hypothetical protein
MTKGKKKTANRPKKQKPAKTSQSSAQVQNLKSQGVERKSHESNNTKQQLLLEMLSKKPGANIDAIVKATGWLPHTSRAMISGLRKTGHKVETQPGKDGKAVYLIVGATKSPAKASR